VRTDETNAAEAFGAEASLAMDFEVEDRAPMDELNAIIWHAVKGADVAYPDAAAEPTPSSPDPDDD
jgi:hypothetical protein